MDHIQNGQGQVNTESVKCGSIDLGVRHRVSYNWWEDENKQETMAPLQTCIIYMLSANGVISHSLGSPSSFFSPRLPYSYSIFHNHGHPCLFFTANPLAHSPWRSFLVYFTRESTSMENKRIPAFCVSSTFLFLSFSIFSTRLDCMLFFSYHSRIFELIWVGNFSFFLYPLPSIIFTNSHFLIRRRFERFKFPGMEKIHFF